MTAAILRHVAKSYRVGSVIVPALRGIDLEVRESCVTAIVGPSGSGKTTLMNLIGGIDREDEGEVVVAGTAIRELSDDELSDFRARHLGFVFQSFNLIPVLTAHENVEYPLRLTSMSRSRRRARAQELLEAVGIASHARHRPAQLSGGQQQRVAIARALVAEPKLVLADEPTANLDSQTGVAIIELLCRLQRERAASVVICSHDPRVIEAADDVIAIRDGRIESLHRPTAEPAAADERRSPAWSAATVGRGGHR